MIALAPPPAPGNRDLAKRLANKMFVTATNQVAAARIANTMFANAVREVRATR
jgi:hypothetical protein